MSLKSNDRIVAEFVTPFTLRMKQWAEEHTLCLDGPIEHRRVPGDAKHPEEGYVLYGAVRHIISGDMCEFGMCFGERFAKPIPETLDELEQTLEDITHPLIHFFWPDRK